MNRRTNAPFWLIISAVLLSLTAPVRAKEFPADITVAADGSGDFRTIQGAIDSIPLDNPRRVVIAIAEGLYNEKVRIDQNCITLRGAGRGRTRIEYFLPRSEYDRRYDRFGVAVVNLFGDDLVLEHLTVDNTQQAHEHAFAVYGQPQRLILDDCDILGKGGDTLSLWNTAYGMYYHRNCTFRGGVDFVCPRGWCFIRDCRFESVNTSAAIWQDGHMDLDMKFVIRNSLFDGPEDFWLGRNHYPSQFYLLDCRFTERMADKPILIVSEPKPGDDPTIYERKYFYNCHRDGGDYPWFADNLEKAPGAPAAEAITPRWTFDGKWDPESTAPPRIESVEVDGTKIHVYFTEPVAGGDGEVVVLRKDGSKALFIGGEGTRHYAFDGGTAKSPPRRFDFPSGRLYATTATLEARYLAEKMLPPAEPRKEITIVLVGDSTVADYNFKHAYQGWGRALTDYFDDRVNVVNWARGGRSSKSFRDEGWWDKAMAKPADYVLIQFGHNDNPGKGPERETDPAPGGDYRANLRRYAEEARKAGAVPVLVSPTTRRFYDDTGQIVPDGKNLPYAEATLAVAEELGCPVVDLNRLTRQLFNQLGKEHSDWLQPVGDRTHFTPTGARRVAGLVVSVLQRDIPELAACVETDPRVSMPRLSHAKPKAPAYWPLAPKFWIPRDDASANPPEELLWPEGVPGGTRDIQEKADQRSDDHINRWVTRIKEPTISIHCPTGKRRTRSAVVICPGGGYVGLAYDKEGHDTARWLNSLGVTAVVLKYRAREYGQPAPGDDAQRAVATVRRRAADLQIDPDKIGIMGYSAGGHVASTAGTRYRDFEIDDEKVSSRPDFMLLVYPVISMDDAITHRGSQVGLLGKNPSTELIETYSNDRQVTMQTPPTFLVHAADDTSVPLENSLRMMRALKKAGVPVELALYERGGHGFGLETEPIPAAQWPLRCEQWLRRQGFLTPADAKP